MKRLLAAGCLLTAATIFLFIGCNHKKSAQTDKTTEIGTKKMTRMRTTSGLGYEVEYEILKEGSGVSPKSGQQVVVHYTGWLDVNGEPGKKFDSSVDRGQPFVFVIDIGKVIKGWDIGVMTMKVGEKRRLYIPAALGYGTRGAGAAIPANANLIFDVELLEIQVL